MNTDNNTNSNNRAVYSIENNANTIIQLLGETQGDIQVRDIIWAILNTIDVSEVPFDPTYSLDYIDYDMHGLNYYEMNAYDYIAGHLYRLLDFCAIEDTLCDEQLDIIEELLVEQRRQNKVHNNLEHF